MVKKIISGGQTGVDRAALDFAIKYDIPHGGWIIKGRIAEDGVLPERYKLQEIPEASYPRRTLKNILESDGTLIISRGPLTGGSDYTRKMAISRDRPCFHIDLNQMSSFQAAEKIGNWIFENKIEILNIAGPRNSKDPAIYKVVLDILETVFYFDIIDSNMPHISGATNPFHKNDKNQKLPKTIDQAADSIIAELSFGDRTKIANFSPSKLKDLTQSMSEEIISRFSLREHNQDLLSACREAAGGISDDENFAVEIIMTRVLEKLRRKRNILKLVK